MVNANHASTPIHDVADLLGGTFPGHTMQRLRTPDGKYRYSYVSSGVKESLGLDPAELMQMKAVDHSWIHPDDRERFVRALEYSAGTLQQLDEEVRVASDGGYKWVRSLGRPRRLADGGVIWDGVALDVTDRREALEALGRTLSQVRQNEASEGRLSYIAAVDLFDRLGTLRAAVDRLADNAGSPEPGTDVGDVVDGFKQFEMALLAARDLANQPDQHDGDRAIQTRRMTHASSLTPRQAEIMDLVSQGASNREIAERSGISEGTVKLHMSAILKRLGARNRTEAARVWKTK